MRGLHPKQVNFPHNWSVEDTKSYTNFPELARDMPQVWTCKFNSEHEWSNNFSNTNGVTKSPTALLRRPWCVAQLDDTRVGRGTFVPWRVPVNNNNLHSWAKFKIVLVRKPGRKFYYFMAKFQGSGFSFPSLNQNIKVVVFPSNFWFQNFKVVVFPSNFWKTTIIWQFFRVILNFSQECYYLKNKVGVVDFAKAQGLVNF